MDLNYLIDEIDIGQRVMERPDHVKAALERWWGTVPERERNKVVVGNPAYISLTPSDIYNSMIGILNISDNEQRSRDYSHLPRFSKSMLATVVEDYEKKKD